MLHTSEMVLTSSVHVRGPKDVQLVMLFVRSEFRASECKVNLISSVYSCLIGTYPGTVLQA
jgi:hypothetical protein